VGRGQEGTDRHHEGWSGCQTEQSPDVFDDEVYREDQSMGFLEKKMTQTTIKLKNNK